MYRIARRDAAIETGLPLNTLPQTCPYSWEERLEPFFPADLAWSES
ncbi:DUF29 family protein [Synechococcus sp. PCC 6312]